MSDAPSNEPSGGLGGFFRKKLDDAKKGLAARGGAKEMTKDAASKVGSFISGLSKSVEHALRTVDWTSFATVLRIRPSTTVEEAKAKLGPPATTEIDEGGEGCCKWGKGPEAAVLIEVAGNRVRSIEARGLVYDIGKPGEVPDDLEFADFSRLHEGMNPFEALNLLGSPATASYAASGRDAEGNGWGTMELTFAWRHPPRTPPPVDVVARVTAGMSVAEVTQLLGRPDEARHLKTQGPDGHWEDRASLAWRGGFSVELHAGAVTRVTRGR